MLTGLGGAGLAAASVLQARRHPGEEVGRATKLGLVVGLIVAVSLFVGVFGGAALEDRLGWWVYFAVIALFWCAGACPTALHNRGIGKPLARP